MTDRLRRGWLALLLGLRRQPALLSAAVLALLAAAIVGGVAVPAARHRLQAARAELARLQDEATAAPDPLAAVQTEVSNLDRFRSRLGDPRHTEEPLATLFVIGRELGLALPQGQYRHTCDEGAAYCRMRIQLPVAGSDLAIRRFADAALSAIPFASVDEISLRRDDPSTEDVEGRVVFSLYLQPERAPAARPATP